MKMRDLFPDIEDREEWHQADVAAQLELEPRPAEPVFNDAPSEMAIGWVGHRGENRAQRRRAVALFKEPEPGLRRKLWLQRQRARRGVMYKKGE